MSAGIIGAKPMIHWQEQLEAAGIPRAPIHDFGQVMDQEQTHAIGIFQEVPETDLKPVGPPISFDGVRLPIGARSRHRRAHRLGPCRNPRAHRQVTALIIAKIEAQ